jgi:hypothetical protein
MLEKRVKNVKIKTNPTVHIYIYISLDTDKYCVLLQEGPVLSRGRAPHDNCNCLNDNQNLVISPRGSSTLTLTDRLSVVQ